MARAVSIRSSPFHSGTIPPVPLAPDHHLCRIPQHPPHMAWELLHEWRQRVAANTQGAAPRLSRNHLAEITSAIRKGGNRPVESQDEAARVRRLALCLA